MSDPDDILPYRSRDSLFETIRRLRIENDNLHEQVRVLKAAFEAEAKHVIYSSEDLHIG